MAGFDDIQADQEEIPWDEYRWERFKNEQDRKTARFIRLLDKYAGHPDREELVVRELELSIEACDDEVAGSDEDALGGEDALGDEALGTDGLISHPEVTDDIEDDGDPDEAEALERSAPTTDEMWSQVRRNAAYQKAHDFCREIHRHIPEEQFGNAPDQGIISFMSHAYGVSAKLAGGLGGSNMGEDLGMSIAYCKRALKEAHRCLEALGGLERDKGGLPQDKVDYLRKRALEVREEVVTQISSFRRMWRTRYGDA